MVAKQLTECVLYPFGIIPRESSVPSVEKVEFNRYNIAFSSRREGMVDPANFLYKRDEDQVEVVGRLCTLRGSRRQACPSRTSPRIAPT